MAKWCVLDSEGYVFFDGPPPHGKMKVFDTQAEAQAYAESGKWHLDGAYAATVDYAQMVERTKRKPQLWYPNGEPETNG